MATVAPIKTAKIENHIGNIHLLVWNFTGWSPLLPVEQNLAAGGAAFADAGDVDGGVLLERAGELAGAAAHAAAGIDARLLEGFGVAGRVDDLGFLDINGLGRDGTPLLADDAVGGHGPGETAATVVKCGAEADGLALRTKTFHPAFFLGRDLPDCAGGADLRAEHATGLAITDARNQGGRPEAFEAGLVERGMERGVGADLHALAAADAAGEEIFLIERAGRAEKAFIAAFAEARVGTKERNHCRTGGEAGDGTAPAQVGRCDFLFIAEEAELEAVMRATAYAVHAHEALGFSPGKAADGIVSALATKQAAVALVTCGRVLVQSQDRPAGDCAEQSAERADGAAPKAGDAQAGDENGQEEDSEDQALGKVRLAEVEHEKQENRMEDFAGSLDGGDVAVLEGRENRTHGEVEGGQKREAERTDQQAERVKPADGRGTEAGGDESCDEDDVFAGLPAFVAVGIDALLAAFGLGGQIADEVLQRAHGADPAAEEAAQKESGQQNDQAPQQAAIEGVTGEGVGDGDQRVELEKQTHRGKQVNVARGAGDGAQRGENQQRKKQQQKEDLRDSA